jgi:molybdopterin converting factor small subunit
MHLADILTLSIAAVVAIVALATFVQACIEYLRSGRQARAQMFFELRRRLKADPLGKIAELIDLSTADDEDGARARRELAALPLRDKRDYVGLFEEVSLTLEWRLVDVGIVHYMFGYYAILCWESTAFWSNNINKWSGYWSKFHAFYDRMKTEQLHQEDQARAVGHVALAEAHGSPEDLRPQTTLKIPPVLRASVGGAKEITMRGDNLRAALTDLIEQWPSVRNQLFSDSGELNRFVNVYLNDEEVRLFEGLDTPLHEGDHIVILPAMTGG